ncbi:hypothetical protein XH99_01050 [Bradyrhizobium nanningense]|uniref:Uncharacterized protein n=1 Tax=Bradyrhizobium nanningense TaxID=1325118 RepID=A0A4Q0SJB6_9BRAD|nr:hypothetical protein [Bradyrhizobium nanningense]RXH34365.1 hypothetical protein XH84_07010 [Bradyrhizobium nanningense]RXH38379.1 hypothetical protein XH99_01050 [Bradyrhizobium nanningense]
MAYECPNTEKLCQCDPDSPDPALRPCALATRVGKFLRMILDDNNLNDNNGNVALVAARKLRSLQQAENYDIARQLETKFYDDADATKIFKRGREREREEISRQPQAPPEFYDGDGYPRWDEIALVCQRQIAQGLKRAKNAGEEEFINDMAGRMMFRQPSEAQGRWLFDIFIRFGGPCNRRTLRFHW